MMPCCKVQRQVNLHMYQVGVERVCTRKRVQSKGKEQLSGSFFSHIVGQPVYLFFYMKPNQKQHVPYSQQDWRVFFSPCTAYLPTNPAAHWRNPQWPNTEWMALLDMFHLQREVVMMCLLFAALSLLTPLVLTIASFFVAFQQSMDSTSGNDCLPCLPIPGWERP